MTQNDKGRFGKLMLAIGEMSAGNEEMRYPSDMKIELYFNALKDLDLDVIVENVSLYFKNSHKAFFPSIADIRNEPNPEDKARKDFELLRQVIDCYYAPGFASSFDIVNMKLDKMNKGYLKQYFRRFGLEIVNNENITATRAQFVRNYTAEERINTSHQIERTGETKQLGDILGKMLSDGNGEDAKKLLEDEYKEDLKTELENELREEFKKDMWGE